MHRGPFCAVLACAGALVGFSCSSPPTIKYFDRVDAVETVHGLRYAVATDDEDYLRALVVREGKKPVDLGEVESLVKRLEALLGRVESGFSAGIVRDYTRVDGSQAVFGLRVEEEIVRLELERRPPAGDGAVWVVLWDRSGVGSSSQPLLLVD